MYDSSKPSEPKRKIGEGHAQAMARQGLREIQAAMYTGSNVAREAEPGTFGNPTQGEIAANRRPEQDRSAFDTHATDARAQARANRERADRDDPGRSPPEPERE